MSTYAEQKLFELNEDNFSSLIPVFEQCCKENASNTAFSCLGQDISYQQLDLYTLAFGRYLIEDVGLQPGDRIAIQLPNLIQYPIAVWAALRFGIIVVNTNPQYTAREQLHQFNDSGATALVVLDLLLPVTKEVLPKTQIKSTIVVSANEVIGETSSTNSHADTSIEAFVPFNRALELGAQHSTPASSISMSDIAVLQYTGGTTGPSKGAMLSHGNIYCAMRMSRASIGLNVPGEPEMPIVVLPLYHVFGFTSSIISTTLHGGHSVLIPNARDLASIISAMKAYPFTYMAGVNTLLQGLMAHPEFDCIDFSHLRGVIAGGTTLVKEIADEWEKRTGTIVYEGYGLSETSSSATCNRAGQNEIGTVGPVIDHAQIKLIDDQGQTVEEGERGEICVRGPNVMQGYWNRPDATAEAIDADGWFKTGDVGVRQANGRIRIVDRIKDMILVSGFNVYPNEIEAVVYGHPAITECAAVGVADPATGEAIKLFVVSQDKNLSAEQIIEFCRQELTSYKVPKQIVFADDLPKSPAGKILRRELRG